MPSLESLHQRFKGKPFVFIAIDIQEKKETVLRHTREKGLTFINLLDKTGEVAGAYGVQSTPVKYLIGPDGNMVGAALGYREWDSPAVHSIINALMKTDK